MVQNGRVGRIRALLAAAVLVFAPAASPAGPGLEERLLAGAPGIRPPALSAGLHALAEARRERLTGSPILTLIDYGLPSTARRLWVLDVDRAQLLLHEWVAHGKGTGEDRAQRFSNEPGSHMSSLGAFLTGATYLGRHGYSLRLRGLEQGLNDRAEERAIVVHGAQYVGEPFAQRWGRMGRSFGCPAVRPEAAPLLIDAIKDGTFLFAYHDLLGD
jgi:hypothetical protein